MSTKAKKPGKLAEIAAFVKSEVVGRDVEIEAIMRAFLAGQHPLLVSETGLAKTAMISRLFRCLPDAETFRIQIEQGMPVEELVGPVNPKKLRADGILERNVEGYLPTAEFAFVDEIFDGSPAILRAMLGILNERIYARGRQIVNCPLRFAIAATNYIPEDERLKAVIDRFLVRIKMAPVHRNDTKGTQTTKMLTAYRDFHRVPGKSTPPILTIAEYDELRRAVDMVVMTDTVLGAYAQLVREYLSRIKSVRLSDRRVCNALSLAASNAVLDGRPEVELADLRWTALGLTVINDVEQTAAFNDAFSALGSLSNFTTNKRSALDDLEELKLNGIEDVRTSMTMVFNALKGSQSKAGLSRLVEIHEQHAKKALETKSLFTALQASDKKGPSVEVDGKKMTIGDAMHRVGQELAKSAAALARASMKGGVK